jgi:hypothetical protein
MSAYEQIDKLAQYLLKHWSHEIGMGDPVNGESAVTVAIRLLERLREGHATSPDSEPEKGDWRDFLEVAPVIYPTFLLIIAIRRRIVKWRTTTVLKAG